MRSCRYVREYKQAIPVTRWENVGATRFATVGEVKTGNKEGTLVTGTASVWRSKSPFHYAFTTSSARKHCR